jgi:hypothetical protein
MTMGTVLEIQCYLSHGCGSEEGLRKNISEALALESVEAKVAVRRIDEAVARALGLRGSPSVLVNGADIQPSGLEGFG